MPSVGSSTASARSPWVPRPMSGCSITNACWPIPASGPAGTRTGPAGCSRTATCRRYPALTCGSSRVVAPIHAQMAAAAADSNIWLAGGGDLVGAFADEGLLDEIHLGVQPVFLGAGAPLLPRRLTSERVTLQSVVRDGQEVNLIYRVGSPG